MLTVFNMTLHALPDLKAQSTDMLSHIQQRVIGQAALFTGPLGSGAKTATEAYFFFYKTGGYQPENLDHILMTKSETVHCILSTATTQIAAVICADTYFLFKFWKF